MFQPPRVPEGYVGCLGSPETRFENRRIADGAHGVHSWDEHGYYEPHSILMTDATYRGGYRALTKPREFAGTLDQLRSMQYHGYGDIANPTIVSPFFRPEPTKCPHDLGHTHTSDQWRQTKQWHLNMTVDQHNARRAGTRAESDGSDSADALKARSTALGDEIQGLAQNPVYRGKPFCNTRSHLISGPEGSPYPRDHKDRLKAEARARVRALSEALESEPKGLAKCY